MVTNLLFHFQPLSAKKNHLCPKSVIWNDLFFFTLYTTVNYSESVLKLKIHGFYSPFCNYTCKTRKCTDQPFNYPIFLGPREFLNSERRIFWLAYIFFLLPCLLYQGFLLTHWMQCHFAVFWSQGKTNHDHHHLPLHQRSGEHSIYFAEILWIMSHFRGWECD